MDMQKTNDLAKLHFDQKNFHTALKLLESVTLPKELIPNLAKCYYYTNQANKALELLLPLEKNENLWIDIALYYNAIGEKQKAFDIYETLDKTNPKVLFNLGWHYLSKNQFQKGFNCLQHGSKVNAWGTEYLYLAKNKLNINKRWNNEYVNHLVYILEGGLGDEIIFLRWANYCKTKCNKLTILCDKSLLRLLINSGYCCEPIDALEYLEYDAYVPAMSLPAITPLENPKQHVTFPYINSFTDQYIVRQINNLAKNKLKIGIKFYGNTEFEHDQFRSPPRKSLEGLEKYGQLFSLQINEQDGLLPNCNHLIKDWQDTYSVFKALDVLVTTCTSTAHLAGAMGIQAIVLVPLVPYFVWASDTMPWYEKNITIIRQTQYNDWSEAMNSLHYQMRKLSDR